MKENKHINSKVLENKDKPLIIVFINLIVIFFSLVFNFCFPKVVTVEQYAYYRTYILYTGYVGIFQLGFINGIYLKYGNLDYRDLSTTLFRKYTTILLVMQIVFCGVLLLLCCSLYGKLNINSAIIFSIISIPIINMYTYYSIICQFTRRFFWDSVTTLGYSIGLLFITLIAKLLSVDSLGILILVFINNILKLEFLAIKNRRIAVPIMQLKKNDFLIATKLVSNGFFIMISEFVSLFILNMDCIFIQRLYAKTEFAIYSFAVSIISFFIIFISTISKMIFPYLMRKERNKLYLEYEKMTLIVIVIESLLIPLFRIVTIVIKGFLPNYYHSINIIIILVPIIFFKTLITLICGNFYKTLNASSAYFLNNIIALVLALVTNIIAVVVFKRIEAIAIATVITFFVWYLIEDSYLRKRLMVEAKTELKSKLIIVISVIIFWATSFAQIIEGVFIYITVIVATIAIIINKDLFEIINRERGDL